MTIKITQNIIPNIAEKKMTDGFNSTLIHHSARQDFKINRLTLIFAYKYRIQQSQRLQSNSVEKAQMVLDLPYG